MSDLCKLTRQEGFTLIELMMVVAALGVVLTIFNSASSQVGSLRAAAAQERDIYQNMMVGRALMEFSQRAREGRLPAEETGNRIPIISGSNDEEKEIFLEALLSKGLSESLGKNDGTRAAKPRRYRVTTENVDTPMFGSSGDRVTLQVDYAAIYYDHDNLPTSFSPRDMEAEDAMDSRAYIFSSRSFQEAKLQTTNVRIRQIRQAINNFVTIERLRASPDKLTATNQNFMPGNNAAGGASMSCGNGGWRTLNASGALSQIGLNSTEFRETAWGHPIYYCRNYGNRSNAPFYGALAVPKKITQPDSTSSLDSNHVVIAL